ncbi:MAG: hypothetical protein J6Q42_00510 [Clostridia bacterium]|nr:hypothetical protein [Clostridia bacterium]
MGIAEDIFIRCGQVLEDASFWLEGRTITSEEITTRRLAASIAGQTAFVLLQKAFITPYNREDIWSWRHACENVWEAAQDLALTKTFDSQGAAACRALSDCAHALQHRSPNIVALLALAERRLCEIKQMPALSCLTKQGLHAVFCLQQLLLKNT